MVYAIENEYLRVEIDSFGAELKRVFLKKSRRDVLYDGKGAWDHSDLLLFPVIGANNEYSLNGVSYRVATRHGFAFRKQFRVLGKGSDTIRFGIEEDEETLKEYPFSFSFELEYRLEGLTLLRLAKVRSKLRNRIVFQYGTHPAFKVDFANAKLHVSKGTALYVLENGIIKRQVPWPHQENWLIDPSEITARDTYVIDNPHHEILLENGMGESVECRYNSPYIAIWTPGRGEENDFLCIEPWYGISPYAGMDKDLSKRMCVQETMEEQCFEDEIAFGS